MQTPEQKKAGAALREAVLDAMRANEIGGVGTVLTDFVLLSASQGYDDEGEPRTSYDYLLADDGMPWHRVLGLLDVCRLMMKDNLRFWNGDE